MESKSYIIMMADMINSQNQPQPATQNKFTYIVNEVNKEYKLFILSPLTITLGDEFQGVIINANIAAQIIIYIEEFLLFTKCDFNLRYTITEGVIDTEINTENCLGMVGQGLTTARRILQLMKKSKERFYIFLLEDKNREQLQSLFKLYSMFMQLWKRSDGGLIEGLIKEKDYKRVALIFNKTPSLIWKRRKSLHIDEYLELKKLFNYAS